MFYAKIRGSREPDNIFIGKKALEKGEVGFSVVTGLSPKGSSRRPLIVTPLIPGTDRFDIKMFDGNAIILNVDNSVNLLPIDKNGHVTIDGKNILDPQHPLWAGERWKIVNPE